MKRPNEFASYADRVFNRLRLAKEGKRRFVAISIRLPEDVIDDPKDIARVKGFSRYEVLARSYICHGLAEDLMRLDGGPGAQICEEGNLWVENRN